jgi:Uncharacterised nucleotidyltransferase
MEKPLARYAAALSVDLSPSKEQAPDLRGVPVSFPMGLQSRGIARVGDVARTASTRGARKVFLRACSALQPADWDGQETLLLKVDSEGWAAVSKLAVQHGVLGLVVRALEWSHQRTGIPIPILERMTSWRQGQLLQMLRCRNTARRVTGALADGGIRFVIFKGMALVEQIYGDLSLRGFRDCDILVDRERLEAAYAILRDLGYSLGIYPTLQEYLVRGKPGIDLRHSDGSLVDLRWAIQGYEMPPSDPEIIWSHCRPREASEELPGWRMSPELTLIHLATHFQVHEYQEIKPLVDFYHAAARLGGRIDIDALFRTARTLDMLQPVDLAARLCERMFVPNPLVARLAVGAPSVHTRLACRILTTESLLRLDTIRPTERRLRSLFCYGAISSSASAFRKMLVPRARELELRFGRPFALGMYPRYYWVQAYRLVARSRKPFSDLA